VNTGLDNKEESSPRRTKERKSTENHKRGTGQLENMAKHKSDRVN
jgi:hypothetical protein